jgi:hypothetical protein
MTFEETPFQHEARGRGNVLSPEAQAKAFGKACKTIFFTAAGRHVLAVLCGGAHPLKHSPGMSEQEHGRSEVVATLWRFGPSDRTIEIQVNGQRSTV